MTAKPPCSVVDCDRPSLARGWCKPHYRRWSEYGDPLAGRPVRDVRLTMTNDPIERYWAQVDKRGIDECWPWLGSIGNGYGHITVDGRVRPAHQVAWELANQQAFPEGLVGDHVCHNADSTCPGGRTRCLHRRCQNPRHIEPATPEDNTLAGYERFEIGDHRE